MPQKTRRRFVLQLLLLGSLFIPNKVSLAQPKLFISAIPDQNPEHLNRMYGLLSAELSKQLGIPVRYVPITNYPAAVSAFRTGSLDLVWFGGLTGVQARLQKPGAKVLAQRDIDLRFQSVFIANLASKIPVIKNQGELKLLKNRRFTFGSESSTSGRLMPQYFLQQAGVEISHFKGKRPGFSGSHDATLALVQSGSYEAGVLNKQVWETNLKRRRVDKSKVRIIWETPTYSDYHWLAQGNLDSRFGSGFTKKLQKTILGFSRESKAQAKILELFGANRFIPAYDYQYREIELIGRQLGKIK
ncbi:putative selenate ABC transporter substrate-binding protein [Prochlorococcus sp. MIT 1307]|uniref:putative selenate ABC transporter substrate-binding protein n=1 Tax=Prochlorococcus sp. MIT 1307 TaxID=3096219 RepID=UPI002A765F00|nr:putative selenate ABC transporter substrate-binding protein [Prochlorococcus sp. MIT 1307]